MKPSPAAAVEPVVEPDVPPIIQHPSMRKSLQAEAERQALNAGTITVTVPNPERAMQSEFTVKDSATVVIVDPTKQTVAPITQEHSEIPLKDTAKVINVDTTTKASETIAIEEPTVKQKRKTKAEKEEELKATASVTETAPESSSNLRSESTSDPVVNSASPSPLQTQEKRSLSNEKLAFADMNELLVPAGIDEKKLKKFQKRFVVSDEILRNVKEKSPKKKKSEKEKRGTLTLSAGDTELPKRLREAPILAKTVRQPIVELESENSTTERSAEQVQKSEKPAKEKKSPPKKMQYVYEFYKREEKAKPPAMGEGVEKFFYFGDKSEALLAILSKPEFTISTVYGREIVAATLYILAQELGTLLPIVEKLNAKFATVVFPQLAQQFESLPHEEASFLAVEVAKSISR